MRSRKVVAALNEVQHHFRWHFHVSPLLFWIKGGSSLKRHWRKKGNPVIWNIKASFYHLTSISSKQHSYFPALDLYTNSPRSSKGRSESFCSCPTSVGSLTLAATCWERRLHLSCRSIASALSTLYFVWAASASAKQASNQRALNWQLFFCTNLRACWWSPPTPLIWESVVKQGWGERKRGRQDVLVHAFVSNLFIHVAVRVHGRVGEILQEKKV